MCGGQKAKDGGRGLSKLPSNCKGRVFVVVLVMIANISSTRVWQGCSACYSCTTWPGCSTCYSCTAVAWCTRVLNTVCKYEKEGGVMAQLTGANLRWRLGAPCI